MRLLLEDMESKKSFMFSDNPFYQQVDGVYSCMFTEDKVEGWYDSPDLQSADFTDLPGADGSFPPGELFLTNRVITIHGFHSNVFGDAASVTSGRFVDDLVGLVGRKVRVTVSDFTGVRYCTGFVASQIPVNVSFDKSHDFSVIITCPDPRKYSNPVEYKAANGRVTVVNSGTMDSWPEFEVINPVRLSFVNVTDDNGHDVEWVGDGATSLHMSFYDLKPDSGRVTKANAFTVQPGEHTFYVTADADSSITVKLASAWR